MRYVVLEPFQPPRTVEAEDIPYEVMSSTVGGTIDIIPMIYARRAERIVADIILNDDGKLIGLEPNLFWEKQLLVGTLMFVAFDNETGDVTEMPDEMYREIIDFINTGRNELIKDIIRYQSAGED